MEDIVATTPLGDAEAPKSIGKRQSFKNGATFYRCKTRFGLLTKDDRIAKYPCELIILELANGNRFVYDIVNVRNPTLAHDSPKGEALDTLKAQTSASGRMTPQIISNSALSRQGGAAPRVEYVKHTRVADDAEGRGELSPGGIAQAVELWKTAPAPINTRGVRYAALPLSELHALANALGFKRTGTSGTAKNRTSLAPSRSASVATTPKPTLSSTG